MSRASPVNWDQVKELFEAVLARPFAKRDAFLDQACAGDDALRSEVASLIKSYERAESFMEAPAVHSAAESLLGNEKRLAAGQQIGHYEVLGAIGEGGMGEVYLARDTRLGRRVALKLLPEYFTSDVDRMRRFKQEARTASTLSHPNVCVIHEVGETEDGRPFITMEYIEGVTLRQRVNSGDLKLGEALDVAVQVADALVSAHEAGIVHRDIKPENIMLRSDGYVKVLDFGLAKLTEKLSGFDAATATTLMRTSTPGLVMGTVAYMSPEQARGVTVDARTDIWSLGVVLYEMVSGHAPFEGETPTDVVVAIVERDQPSLAQFVSDLPAELDRIIKKALRKDRDERYQLAKELAIDLRSLRRDLQVEIELGRSVAPPSNRTTADGIKKAGQIDGDTDEVVASRLTAAAISFPDLNRGTRIALACLASLFIVFAALGYRFLHKNITGPPVEPFQKINVTKLTTNGNAAFACISPDGRYVAYVMNQSGKQSLWLRQVSVASNVQLVPPRDGQYLGIAFSPDGNYLYYGHEPPGENNGELYRVPVLAMGAAATKMSIENGPSKLSHDGKHIAFLRADRKTRAQLLVIADASGGNEQIVTSRNWPEHFGWSWDSTPVWSADDSKLDVVLVEDSLAKPGSGTNDSRNAIQGRYRVDLCEIRLADRTEQVVPLAGQRFAELDNVTLLADGGGAIVSAKAPSASFQQIWYLGRDGSARRITNDLSDYREPTLNADGTAFVTVQTQTLSNIWAAPKGQPVRANAITSGAGRYFDLAWTPDGKILYASDASGSADIYEIEADGSGQRQLTSDSHRNYAPAISPDGRYIAFHSNRSGTFQIWRMDRDGSNPKQLTTNNSESNWPQFSADGKWVIYQHFESGVPGTLWKVSVDGGSPIKITDGFGIRPALSPDGKWIAYWYNEGQRNPRWRLGIIPFENGTPVRTFDIAPTVQVQWDTLLRWSADGSSVTYVDHRGGVDNLWAQPIAGGPPKQLTDFKDSQLFTFDWHTDGRLITSRGVITSDVVMINDANK